MSYEQDIQVTITPPTYSLPTTSSQSESKIIDLTVTESSNPSNVIIYSGSNLPQFITTTHSFVRVKEGNIPIRFIANAAKDTGDLAVEVEDFSIPPELEEMLRNEYQGVISNDKGALAWQGKSRMLLTSAPIHPFTGEKLVLPGQISDHKILQFPQTQTTVAENPASQPAGGDVVPQNDTVPDNLSQFIKPLTNPDWKKEEAA